MKKTNLENNIIKELLGVEYNTHEEMIDDLGSFADKNNISNWGDEDSGSWDVNFYISMGNYHLGIIENSGFKIFNYYSNK